MQRKRKKKEKKRKRRWVWKGESLGSNRSSRRDAESDRGARSTTLAKQPVVVYISESPSKQILFTHAYTHTKKKEKKKEKETSYVIP